jgi:hypothetical protein
VIARAYRPPHRTTNARIVHPAMETDTRAAQSKTDPRRIRHLRRLTSPRLIPRTSFRADQKRGTPAIPAGAWTLARRDLLGRGHHGAPGCDIRADRVENCRARFRGRHFLVRGQHLPNRCGSIAQHGIDPHLVAP